MEKLAGITDKLVQILKNPKAWSAGFGATASVGAGYTNSHPDKGETIPEGILSFFTDLVTGKLSGNDIDNAAADAALGGSAGLLTHKLFPGKKLPIALSLDYGYAHMDPSVRRAVSSSGPFVEGVTDYVNQSSALLDKKNILAAIGIGAGALALTGGGYALYKWLQDRKEDRASRTRMKMKISTPDGKDAIVDLPINNPELSSKLSDEFNRGVTRTVRRTARYNSMKLDPETNKYIPFPDWHKKYGNGQGTATYTGQATGETGDEYTQKAANLTNMPAYNLVDRYPEPAKESGYDLTKSDRVRRFLDALDIPLERLDKMASSLAAKQSGSLGEIFGTVASPILTGTAAGIAANKLFDVPTNQSLMIGAGAAGLSSLLGAAAAGIAPSRTQAEQEQHDMTGHSLLNILMPGAAMFNAVQRAKALPEQPDVSSVPTINQPIDQAYQKPIVENKPLQQSDDFFDEEDDI